MNKNEFIAALNKAANISDSEFNASNGNYRSGLTYEDAWSLYCLLEQLVAINANYVVLDSYLDVSVCETAADISEILKKLNDVSDFWAVGHIFCMFKMKMEVALKEHAQADESSHYLIHYNEEELVNWIRESEELRNLNFNFEWEGKDVIQINVGEIKWN